MPDEPYAPRRASDPPDIDLRALRSDAEREREVAIRLAKLEDLIKGVSEDVAAVRESSGESLKVIGSRVSLLEVNVRALEDWRLAQKVLENERKAVAEQVADDRQHEGFTRRQKQQFWIGLLASGALTILAAWLASGRLF